MIFNKYFRQISILFVLFIFSICGHADQYSLSEYIDFLQYEHTYYKHQQSVIKDYKYQYNKARAVVDWNMDHALFSSHVQPYQTSSFINDHINTFGTLLSINRPILTTGGRLSISFRNQKIMQDAITFNGTSFGESLYFENEIGVSYTHPLLYGSGGDLIKLPILIASTNVKTMSLTAVEDFESFLHREINQYIDWALQNELTELSFGRLQLARESLKQTKERVSVNLSEKIDLLRAEDAVQKAHQQWLTQKAQLKAFQFKLASRAKNPAIKSKVPTFDLYETNYIKKPDYVRIDKLRAAQSIQLVKLPLEEQLSITKKQRNGDLSIVANYAFRGGDTQFNDSLKYVNNNSSISFNYSRPLTDTNTIEKLKSEHEQLSQIKLNEEQYLIDLESEIISLYVLIQEYKDILDTNLNQIIIAENKAEEENALYRQGRSSLDMVIQAQDNLINSKLSYSTLSAMYQKQVISYKALTDVLLNDYNITL